MSQFSEPNTSEHGLDPGKMPKYSFQYVCKKESVGMLPSLTLKEASEGREPKGTGMRQTSKPQWLGCLRQVWPIFISLLFSSFGDGYTTPYDSLHFFLS